MEGKVAAEGPAPSVGDGAAPAPLPVSVDALPSPVGIDALPSSPGEPVLGRWSAGPDGRPVPPPERVSWLRHPLHYCLNTGNSWFTDWKEPEEVATHKPHKGDFRDQLPPLFEDVVQAYEPLVKDGRWTLGLMEMWFPKAKYVKQSVHVPCWDSFRWLPWKWRGVCFGRTMDQCWWTGLRYSRWARAVYAAGLGREYRIPEWLMPGAEEGEITHHDRISGLCMQNFLIGTALSLVMGVFLTCGGFGLFNCGACYSCHAREKMRRRFNLPPAFGLPPGIDDCLVHFICFYCASHQELRELVLRGVDGPGLHILDVLPKAFPGVPGVEEQVARRRAQYLAFGPGKPRRFHARGPCTYCPPPVVEMTRGPDVKGAAPASKEG